MNFEQARKEWLIAMEELMVADRHAHRVARDALPINAEDVTILQALLADVGQRLERLLRRLS